MIEINITQHHINTGTVSNAFHCAIASALKEEFAYKIKVTPAVIRIGNEVYKSSDEVARWISDFDKGPRAVMPITIGLIHLSMRSPILRPE